jgi:SEC-C motif domain protein
MMGCMLENNNKKAICYCGSQKYYEECCFPFISGSLKPKNPEQLMRSRYSAFCIKDIEYLISTHHFSKRQLNECEILAQTIQETQWLGLKVLKTEKDSKKKYFGYVEFVAFYKNGQIEQLHENSKFIHENGHWYYLDGVILEPLKFARKEPCWCGSMKKFKKCHGK